MKRIIYEVNYEIHADVLESIKNQNTVLNKRKASQSVSLEKCDEILNQSMFQ